MRTWLAMLKKPFYYTCSLEFSENEPFKKRHNSSWEKCLLFVVQTWKSTAAKAINKPILIKISWCHSWC